MGKPSKNELDSAFEEAKKLIWQEQDQDFLAKSLFALHDQSTELTKVLSACETYIQSGQSTTAHRGIISAMNAYRNMYSSSNADYVVSETAGLLRETGNDQHFIAKTVLNLNYMVKQLETVYRATERYLHSGMSITEHQHLENAIKKYRTLENRTSGSDVSAFSVY